MKPYFFDAFSILSKDNKSPPGNTYFCIKSQFDLSSLGITLIPIIKKTNEENITLTDCSKFNDPASAVIENSNLLKCSYVLEISSQGVSDELTSERDFKTFKGFPVNVELNPKKSKQNFLNGLLYEKSKDFLAINIKGKIKKIPLNEVLKISLCTLKD